MVRDDTNLALEEKIRMPHFRRFGILDYPTKKPLQILQRLFENQNQQNYALAGAGFNCPIQTFLPCNFFTRNIIPTNMKKNGPVKPNKATNLVP